MILKRAVSFVLILCGTASIVYGLGTETKLVDEVLTPILLYIVGISSLFGGIYLASTEKSTVRL